MKKLFIILTVLSLALPVHAHHLWISSDGSTYTVNRGNILKGQEKYSPGCIKTIKAYGKTGQQISLHRTDAPDRAVFSTAKVAVLATAISDWGYRINTTLGKKLMSPAQARAEGLKIISVFKSTQFSKALFHPSTFNTTPLGMKFEIVPLTDPLTTPPDRPVFFRLLFAGSPLPCRAVYTRDNQEIKTNENGIFSAPVRDGGVYLFYAKHKIPGQKGQDINYIKYMTFLTFEVTK